MAEMHGYQRRISIRKQVLFFLVFKFLSKAVVFCESNEFDSISQKNKEPQRKEDLATTITEYYSGYNLQLEPPDDFKIGSEYCKNKSTCSELLTFPDKLCHCDKLCGLLNDCCGNHGYTSTLSLAKGQFKCISLYEIVKNRDYGVTMVTKCSPKWQHAMTKSLCEVRAETDGILLRLPVSDKTEFHVMYKNMYCAQCNFVNNFHYWKQEILCQNETGARSLPEMKDCILFFIRPQPKVSYRTCQLSRSIISKCNKSAEMTTEILGHECADGVYAITYDESGMMYRNEYCAMCNGVVKDAIFCEPINAISIDPVPTAEPRSSYSLRLIVDFNTGSVTRNGNEEEMIQCKGNEIFDGFSHKCREIFCAPPLSARNGMCSIILTDQTAAVERAYPYHTNCTLTKLDPSEYELRNNSISNNSKLFMLSHGKVYSMDQLHWNGSDVFVCLGASKYCSHDCKGTEVVLYSDVIESYLTVIGLVLSIILLAITLAVYIAFQQLLNTPGKILVSLIVSLILAQMILFVTAAEVEHIPKLCFTVGVLVHYFFLAAFCWMNVIAFDLWMTFSHNYMTPVNDRKGRKRFTIYSLYSWLLPVSIVSTAVILDFVNFDVQFYSLKPRYGNGVCWITSRNALILFFAGPLAIFKIFDIISFISTAVHIARAKNQGAMATGKKNTCSFIVNLKLSLIMGLTWMFAFVANATNEASIWYMFIIFNSLQGLFIAMCFLCTKKVGRLMRDKYAQITTKTAPGTQMTSLT